MPHKCSVVGCGATKSINQPNLTIHRLPRNENTKRIWLEAIGKENLRKDIKEVFICSLHFEESSYNRTLDVIRLREDAVPSLFCKSRSPDEHKTSSNEAIANQKNLHLQRSSDKHKPSSSNDVENPSERREMEIWLVNLHLDKVLKEVQHLKERVVSQRRKIKCLNESVRRYKMRMKRNRSNDFLVRQISQAKGVTASRESGSTVPVLSCYACGVELSKKILICVECENLTMCGECERDNLHPHHCVLRIPSQPIYDKLRSVLESLQRELSEKLSVKGDEDEDPFQLGGAAAADDEDSQHAKVDSKESSSKPMIKSQVPADKPKTKRNIIAKASTYDTTAKARLIKSVVVKRPSTTATIRAHKKFAVEKIESKTIVKETDQLKDSSESGTKVPLPVEPEIYVPGATAVTHNAGDPLLIKEEPDDVEMQRIEHPDGDPGPSSASFVEFGSHKRR